MRPHGVGVGTCRFFSEAPASVTEEERAEMEIFHALLPNSVCLFSFRLRFVHHFRFAKSKSAPSQIFLLGNPLNISLWSLSGPPGACPPFLGDAGRLLLCWTITRYLPIERHAEPQEMANR